MPSKKRILIIGETGSGKSSLIKLLTGNQTIETSDSAIGCTFDCKVYENDEFAFIDTTGLGEGSKGTVPDANAIKQLINFLKANKEGFSLMVMVRQKGKITKIDENNYKLFYEALCEEKIPNLLVFTRCEFDNPINQWWDKNKKFFIDQYKMNFVDGICICAADDETIKNMNPEVHELIERMRESSKSNLIEAFNKYSLHSPVPLYIKRWYEPFLRVLRIFLKVLGFTADKTSDWLKSELEKLLIKIGFSSFEAEEIAKV